MKKIKEVKGFDTLYVYKDSIVVWNKKSIQLVDNQLDLSPLVEGNIFVVKILGDELFYQLNDEKNIHVYGKDIVLKDDFAYGLISALKCDTYTYIPSKRYKSSIFLDDKLGYINGAPRYCRTSYRNFLFDNDKNTIICYELNSKLWDYSHNNESKLEIISGYKDKVLVYSESGDLFALSLDNGNVVWKYPENCHHP